MLHSKYSYRINIRQRCADKIINTLIHNCAQFQSTVGEFVLCVCAFLGWNPVSIFATVLHRESEIKQREWVKCMCGCYKSHVV